MHPQHLQSLITSIYYTKTSSVYYFFGGEKTSSVKWDFSKETFRLMAVITHVALLLQGAAETHTGAPASSLFAVFVVFKLENSGMVTALITTQSSIFICRLSFCVVSSEELDKLIWWLMFINQNETDPRPEMPTGRAIIFLNAPVRFQKCTRLCWHVVRGKRRFGEFKRRQTG